MPYGRVTADGSWGGVKGLLRRGFVRNISSLQMTKAPILLVDDDENDLYLLKYALNQAGVANKVITAVDGQESLDYLFGREKFGDREVYPLPSLLLLDLKLPLKSGFEVLREVRAAPRFRNLVVIVVSASGHMEDVQRAYELGANSYIMKPSGMDELRRIAELVKVWWLELNLFAPVT